MAHHDADIIFAAPRRVFTGAPDFRRGRVLHGWKFALAHTTAESNQACPTDHPVTSTGGKSEVDPLTVRAFRNNPYARASREVGQTGTAQVSRDTPPPPPPPPPAECCGLAVDPKITPPPCTCTPAPQWAKNLTFCQNQGTRACESLAGHGGRGGMGCARRRFTGVPLRPRLRQGGKTAWEA